MSDEIAIEETVARARELLFDEDGKPKGPKHFAMRFTLATVLRPASGTDSVHLQAGQSLIDVRSTVYVYDAGVAELLLHDARNGDPFSDQVLRNAAALILDATGGLSDGRLRALHRGTSKRRPRDKKEGKQGERP